MALFTMKAETLHAALVNVAPHAATDDTLPVLAAIRVEVDTDGLVTFVATDRYTIGVAEVASYEQAALEPGAFLLPRTAVAAIAKLAKGTKYGDVTVDADDSTTVTARAITGTSLTDRLELGEFPKWRTLFPPADKSPVEVSRIGIGAAQLAKFAKLYHHGRIVKHPTLDVTFYGATKPVVVDVQDVDLRALVMPIRLGDK